jgi:hypothetical protein
MSRSPRICRSASPCWASWPPCRSTQHTKVAVGAIGKAPTQCVLHFLVELKHSATPPRTSSPTHEILGCMSLALGAEDAKDPTTQTQIYLLMTISLIMTIKESSRVRASPLTRDKCRPPKQLIQRQCPVSSGPCHTHKTPARY